MSPQTTNKLKSFFSPKKDKAVPKATIEQTQFINSSLSALGNVVHALGNQQESSGAVHVPYRDSKLTFMLQDCLSGSSCTGFIVCVSPDDEDISESLNSLRFAARLRTIKHTDRPIDALKTHAKKLQEQKNQIEEEKQNTVKELSQAKTQNQQLAETIDEQRRQITELQKAEEKQSSKEISPKDIPIHEMDDNQLTKLMEALKWEAQHRGLRTSASNKTEMKSPPASSKRVIANKENTPESHAVESPNPASRKTPTNKQNADEEGTPSSRRKKRHPKSKQTPASSKREHREKAPVSRSQLYDFNGRRIRSRKDTIPSEDCSFDQDIDAIQRQL